MKINYICNSFFESFVIEIPKFGYVSLGYFNAFKSIELLSKDEKSKVLKILQKLFKKSSIIAGDINSTPFKIEEVLKTLDLKSKILSKPSYMFPKKYLKKDVELPAFDNFIIIDDKISKSSIKSLIELPTTLNIDPRKYMVKIKSPSDHIPLVGNFYKNNENIKIGIYNVADPVFWGKFYESTKHGFDVSEKGETKRQQRLYDLIKQMVESTDLVFLTEVPSSFVKSSSEIASLFGKNILVKDTLHNGKKIKGISKNILIYKNLE